MKQTLEGWGLVLIVIGLGGLLRQATADDSAWVLDENGNWSDAGNWDAGVPGSTTVLNSADIATFAWALTADRTVTVDANRNIGGITFGNSGERAYTLSGGPLLVSSGGLIQNAAGNGGHTNTIGAAIAIQGNGGTATFSNNGTANNSALAIAGDVSGVAASGKTNTLTLTGTYWNTAEHRVSGLISDGSGGGRLALVKSGITNTWVLSGANTFSGGVNLQGGTLIVENGLALGSGIVTQQPATTLALRGGVTVSGKTLVLGGGTPSAYGSLDGFGGTNTWAGNVTFAGVGPRLNCANGTLIITGSVTVNSASGNPTIGGFGDGEFRGVISGVSSKTLFRSSTDTGTWSLLGTNTFAGSVTCANGTIAINNNKSLGSRTSVSATALTLGGAATRGTLRTLADVVLTNFYGISLHNAGGIIRTDEGTRLTVNGIIADRTSAPYGGPLTKTGSGTLVLNAANTFSNLLEVAEGTVLLGQANALAGLSGNRPKLKVNATLDLGGHAIAAPVLSGANGAVTNGSLTVTVSTQLGGDGTLAPLSVPASTLSGTFTADVETDGSSDRLNVFGPLALNGVSLSVADTGKLEKSKIYTLAQCTGGAVSGLFAGHNLPEGWWIDCSDAQIRLRYFTGMILNVK